MRFQSLLKVFMISSLLIYSGCLFEEIAVTGLGLRDTYDTILVSDGTYLYKAGPANYVNSENNTTIQRTNIETGETTQYLGTSMPAYTDGAGAVIRFNNIRSMVAIPNSTKIYIGDNCTIRRLDTQSNSVTTVAGSVTTCGGNDGVATSARFSGSISGLTYNDGFLYAADGYAIRKINLQTMQVTTVAGGFGLPGDQNGIGTYSRFGEMADIIYLNDHLYFGDVTNKKIRKLALSTSQVTTVFGDGTSASTDGTGVNAKVNLVPGTRFTTDGSRTIFFTEQQLIRKMNIDSVTIATLVDSRDTLEDIDGTTDSAKVFYATGIAYTINGLFISNFYGIRRLR